MPNKFQSIILDLIKVAAQDLPIFIHSPNGMIILNAGEGLLAAILAELATRTPATPAGAPVQPGA